MSNQRDKWRGVTVPLDQLGPSHAQALPIINPKRGRPRIEEGPRPKPWLKTRMSRTTWYRRQAELKEFERQKARAVPPAERGCE